MNNKKGLTRLTIDISPELHKTLKVKCAVIGKSMRALLIEAIEEKVQFSPIKINEQIGLSRSISNT